MLDSSYTVSTHCQIYNPAIPAWKGEFKFCVYFLHDMQNLHYHIASNVSNIKCFWPLCNLIFNVILADDSFCNLAES